MTHVWESQNAAQDNNNAFIEICYYAHAMRKMVNTLFLTKIIFAIMLLGAFPILLVLFYLCYAVLSDSYAPPKIAYLTSELSIPPFQLSGAEINKNAVVIITHHNN